VPNLNVLFQHACGCTKEAPNKTVMTASDLDKTGP
jgi:hypothetical protein